MCRSLHCRSNARHNLRAYTQPLPLLPHAYVLEFISHAHGLVDGLVLNRDIGHGKEMYKNE